MTEIMDGMQALNNTLALSLLVVALLLLPVVLFFASRMAKPIANMRAVALTMAGGDLTARADDHSSDEYGELGRALNYLSSELGSTISSLEMERNRLQSLINGLSEGIIAVDAQGSVTLLNPAVYGLLSLSESTADVRNAAPDVFVMFDEALRSGNVVKKTIWQGDIALPYLRFPPASAGRRHHRLCRHCVRRDQCRTAGADAPRLRRQRFP